MSKADYWATAPMNRSQSVLFSPTLDDSITEDHPVRVLDEVLGAMDWRRWEAHYPFRQGQPPIHPRKLASAILYGWTVGVKSGRQLEYAAGNNLDFIWLLEGLRPDHSTFCKFRSRFKEELKDLFKATVRYAMGLGLVKLNQVAFDGTQVKANSSRYRTWKAEEVERVIASLDRQIDEMLQEADALDIKDHASLGDSANDLPDDLKDCKRRRAKLQEISETLKQMDQEKRRQGSKAQSQVPKTDTDSRVLMNKDGGYAPNYTPINGVDGASGVIVHAEVIQGNAEYERTLLAVDEIEEACGQRPEEVLADSAFATGPNLKGMEEREIDFYSPLKSNVPQEGNPAKRDDPTQPVKESEFDQLPYRDKKKTQIDKSAFIYVHAEDTYYCPMGKAMPRTKSKGDYRYGQHVRTWIYRCDACCDCPLRSRCVSPKGKLRTITRDEYEPYRERLGEKMANGENQEKYNRRIWIAETPFAVLKRVLGLRQFLTRGLSNVDHEWCWACTAFNLKKIVARTIELRAYATASD